MAHMVMPTRYGRGRLIFPSSGSLPNADFGPVFNDWVVNPNTGQPRTTGPGGDYPSGRAFMPFRSTGYYLNPFDMATCNRPANAGKPFNNWILFCEYNGPGTVSFNLAPDAAAPFLGQSQVDAYNDYDKSGLIPRQSSGHGGGLHLCDASPAGSWRIWFDGNQQFLNGVVFLDGRSDRIGFGSMRGGKGTFHTYPITTWRSYFDVICSIRGITDPPGFQIPDDFPNGTYTSVWFDPRMHGNSFNCGWRIEGATRVYRVGAIVDHVGDDANFLGSGSDHNRTIGCVFTNFDNRDGGPYQGDLVNNRFHNDGTQLTGEINDYGEWDCTEQGHAFEHFAENGQVTNVIIDRISQGICGRNGGESGVLNGFTMAASVTYADGAPQARITGHYIKGFSNGYGTLDGNPQITIDNFISTFHSIEINFNFGDPKMLAVMNPARWSVTVPSGSTVSGPSALVDVSSYAALQASIAAFVGSPDVAHQVWRTAYAGVDLPTILAENGISLD